MRIRKAARDFVPPGPPNGALCRSALVGEDEVELLAGLVDHVERLLALLRGAGRPHLPECLDESTAGLPDLVQAVPVDAAPGLLPRSLGPRVGLGAAGVGKRE